MSEEFVKSKVGEKDDTMAEDDAALHLDGAADEI